jgi:hypothetical protein
MSVSCVGAIAGSAAPAEVIPVIAIVIDEVPGGVATGCVTGALCAGAPPPPHPVTVQSASATRGTNTPPQTKRECVPISRQRRKACAAITHNITPARMLQEHQKRRQSQDVEPCSELQIKGCDLTSGDAGGEAAPNRWGHCQQRVRVPANRNGLRRIERVVGDRQRGRAWARCRRRERQP